MDVNSLPKTVTRQGRSCDLNPGPSAPESSTLTTRQPSHPWTSVADKKKSDASWGIYFVCFMSDPVRTVRHIIIIIVIIMQRLTRHVSVVRMANCRCRGHVDLQVAVSVRKSVT